MNGIYQSIYELISNYGTPIIIVLGGSFAISMLLTVYLNYDYLKERKSIITHKRHIVVNSIIFVLLLGSLCIKVEVDKDVENEEIERIEQYLAKTEYSNHEVQSKHIDTHYEKGATYYDIAIEKDGEVVIYTVNNQEIFGEYYYQAKSIGKE